MNIYENKDGPNARTITEKDGPNDKYARKLKIENKFLEDFYKAINGAEKSEEDSRLIISNYFYRIFL
ncbi:MAG: hypothetical protein ACRCZ0_08890 [Cetobacterium sp.]